VDPLWDVFLSHGSPDKPWVESLTAELRALGLRPFLDAREIEPGDSFPHVLSDGLAGSRFLVLILSPHSSRPWVNLEWASYLSHHGPLGRLIPVLLEPTEIPTLLASVQRIDATHRDAARVAGEIAHLAGRPGELKEDDARRLVLGQDLVFHLAHEGEELRVTDPVGHTRTVTPPWRVDNSFGIALHFFDRLSREPAETDEERADLFARATTLGSLLFDLLFDEAGRERLRQAMIPGRPRPLITIRSEDDSLLSLPWELLHHDGSFLLRDARVDLARSTPGEMGPEALLREASESLKLVVNVSAPEGSHLDYEGESYRITRALSERCRFVPTELGSLDDLVETVRAEKPTAIHFSGHGAPGALAFEDEEGREDQVSTHDLVAALRKESAERCRRSSTWRAATAMIGDRERRVRPLACTAKECRRWWATTAQSSMSSPPAPRWPSTVPWPFLAEGIRKALAPQLVGRLMGTVGVAHAKLGDVEKAIGFYEQALVIFREIGDRRGEGASLGNLALAYTSLGEEGKAFELYEQQLAIAREIGDRKGESSSLGNLGLAYAALGKFEQAIGFYVQRLLLPARSATVGEKVTPWAIWVLPFFALGNWKKPSSSTSSRWLSIARLGIAWGKG
jgi:tetratricopeptide (TPR) repeat protein